MTDMAKFRKPYHDHSSGNPVVVDNDDQPTARPAWAAAREQELENNYNEPESESEHEELPYVLQPAADLKDLTRPGGVLQDLIDWIVSSSDRPSRVLALAAALPFIGALMGKRYSTGNRDTRPNLYTVALAPSGFGKDHARGQIKRLQEADERIGAFSGPARLMSASALRNVIDRDQSVFCQIDEFGAFIKEITDRRASEHKRNISADLREYYSASSTVFEGAEYSKEKAKKISNPMLCISGTSTPAQFWDALNSSSSEDGLLARFILFNVEGKKPRKAEPKGDVRDLDHSLLGALVKLSMPASMRDTSKVTPKVVPWSDDAKSILADVMEAIEEKEERVEEASKPFLNRIVENGIKLALIVAVSKNHSNPEITAEDADWAFTVAWTCASSMIKEVDARVADNVREATVKRVLDLIRKAGTKGITSGLLVNKLASVDSRMREDVLTDLMEGDRIRYEKTRGAPGRPTVRFWIK